jgi:hypothetical protein
MLAMVLGMILSFQAGNGVVSGQLKTVEGGPAVAVRVIAIPAPPEQTRPSFGSQYFYQQPPVSTSLTDNQGRYRLTNLPPGRYYIMSGISYYPSTLDPDRATAITITPDSNMTSMDFQLQQPLGGRVSGRITPKPEGTGQIKGILSGPALEGLLEIPIGADGIFEFGHVPTGAYLLDLVPTFPGLGSFRVDVGTKDVTGLELVRPPTHAVTGKIVVENGPLPRALLAFFTNQSYVDGPINPDGTFSIRLHSARHRVVLAGMPGGYAVTSVRLGNQDLSQGIPVGNADVSGIIINVSAPRQLPRMRGQVTGLANSQLASTKVEVTGPINGSLEAPLKPDGSFEFAALTPGMYRLRVPQVPAVTPMNVVVTWNDADIQVAVPAR